jgi:hypothetical protein
MGLAAIIMAGLLITAATPPVAHTGHIDDNGNVIAAEQTIHAKKGHTVTWQRQTAGKITWHVQFDNNKTPCSEGAEFGHDRVKTCTISAGCDTATNPNCRYPYTSALSKNGAPHDPDIVIDPDGVLAPKKN